MGTTRTWIALALVGCLSALGCTSEDKVDWAEVSCADYLEEVPGAAGIESLPEPTTVGEMREVLVDTGATSPSEWRDLSDDDLLAQCVYALDGSEVCRDSEPSSLPSDRRVTFLVDESGHGVELGTTGPALTPADCKVGATGT